MRVLYDEGEETGTFCWANATLVDATSDVSNISITVSPVSTISETIANLEPGQYLNIHASNDNGTPEDGSDDFGFGLGMNGSGSGTDGYDLRVPAMSGYRDKFSPNNATPIFYKANDPNGTWLWEIATLVDAANDVSGIDITIQLDSDNDGLMDTEAAQHGTDQDLWKRQWKWLYESAG